MFSPWSVVRFCLAEEEFSSTRIDSFTGAQAAMAVDPYGGSHFAFQDATIDGTQECPSVNTLTTSVVYLNGTTKTRKIIGPKVLTIVVDEDCRSILYGQWIRPEGIDIAIDSTGSISISYVLVDYDTGDSSIMLATAPKLLALIPGINDHGNKMIEGAASLLRFDNDCVLRICEKERNGDEDQVCDLVKPSKEQISQRIVEKLATAKERGKDLVVDIDMDLENYNFLLDYFIPEAIKIPGLRNKWFPSTEWAGNMANTVSEVFKQNNPLGSRLLWAHSAGVDAANRSLAQNAIRNSDPQPMYDNLILFNGRTNADAMKNNLQLNGYRPWQTKVFTNSGDFPAAIGKSLSNYSGAANYAGLAWTHLHSPNLLFHNGLRNNVNENNIFDFQVNVGSSNWNILRRVRAAIMTDWRPEAPLLMGQ